jgi:hypothetical protein
MASPQELVVEQRKTLKEFYQIYDPHRPSVDQRELNDIRERYNKVTARLNESLPRPSLSDPLSVLPPELLVQCFLNIPHDRTDGYGLFKLLSVSRAWRYFLKSSSVLWNRIAFGEGRMSVDQIRLSLALSKSTPLYLEILLQDHFSDSPLIMADLLRNETHRIREILLQHHSRYDGEALLRDLLFRDTLAVLRGLGTFSTCECLTYIGSPMDGLLQVDGRELPSMPAIRHLIGFSLDSSTLDINLDTIMHFSSASSAFSLEPILQRCNRLQQLDLLDTLEQNINFREPPKLPSLEVLVFDRSGVSNIRPFLMLKGDRLRTLHLKLQWFELADMTFLSYLPVLTHLSIDFVIPKYPLRELAISIPPLPKVEEFHFNERSELPEGELVNNPPSLDNLFTALLQNVPQPRTLSFDLCRPAPPRLLLRYLKSLTDLEDLQYHHEKPYTEILNEPPTRLESLKRLTLTNETFLQYLELPFLVDLWIDAVGGGGTEGEHANNSTSEVKSTDSLESSLKLFQENRYPAIQTLTWNGSVSYETLRHCSVITTSITSLRKVVFSEAYARKDANDFCEVLLRLPTACPNLETIAFHCYPSWDLLFHMLLRRNFMPGSTVTPLRSIHLPGYPSKTFLTPLIDLLSQRVPLLPALSQIALSFRNGVFDPALYVY